MDGILSFAAIHLLMMILSFLAVLCVIGHATPVGHLLLLRKQYVPCTGWEENEMGIKFYRQDLKKDPQGLEWRTVT